MTETGFSQLLGRVHSLMNQEGISEPSEIQKRAIPAILSGKSVLVIAPTGTGKTYAAMLPIFQLFLQLRSEEEFYVEILKAERDYARTRMFWG